MEIPEAGHTCSGLRSKFPLLSSPEAAIQTFTGYFSNTSDILPTHLCLHFPQVALRTFQP
jgi:hypothetical protein